MRVAGRVIMLAAALTAHDRAGENIKPAPPAAVLAVDARQRIEDGGRICAKLEFQDVTGFQIRLERLSTGPGNDRGSRIGAGTAASARSGSAAVAIIGFMAAASGQLLRPI